MTWLVLTNKINRKLIPLFFIILIGTFLRFYKINQAFPFDYDQEVPAAAAFDFFVNHKITLIGQELSFKGFFLGPLHNWIQFIPYGFCGLSPDCVAYFYILIGVLTIIVLFFVVKKIFDSKTATIASAIYAISFSAISFERGVNSNYFLFLSSIGLLFCLYKYFLGQNKFLIFGAFIAGLAVVNFNPVFIFSAIAFFLTALIRPKRSVLIIITAGLAFLINYAPLVIFNFRHQNILLDNILQFLRQNMVSDDYFGRSIFIAKNILVPFYSYFFFQGTNIFLILFTVCLVIWSSYKFFLMKNRFLYFFPIWIIVTFLGFTFYKGHIPEYYFQQTLLPSIILTSFALRENKFMFIIFTFLFLLTNIRSSLNYESGMNYKVKKEVINYVINDSWGKSFNVYYDMPPGINTGYNYLFKAFGKNPQENAKNLYILEFINPVKFQPQKYLETYRHKKIKIKVIGFVHIVSVK